MDMANNRKRLGIGVALGLCSVLVLGTTAALADIDIDKNAPSQSKPAAPAVPAKQSSTFTPKPPAAPQPATKPPKEDK
jgi:hypothetical protein